MNRSDPARLLVVALALTLALPAAGGTLLVANKTDNTVDLVDPAGGRVTVTCEVDDGLEIVDVDLPAVLTADLRLNEPRYVSLPGILKAKKKPVDVVPLAECGDVGESFSRM